MKAGPAPIGHRRAGRERRPRSSRRLFRFVCLLFALGLGLLIIGKKVAAETPAPGLDQAPRPPAKAALSVDAAIGPRAGNPNKPGTLTVEGEVDSGGAGGTDAAADAAFDPRAGGLDYAVVQTEEDFAKDLSVEGRALIGDGKVPIHREGAYRSPLAHPRFGGPAHAKVGLVIREIRDFNIQSGGFEADFFVSITGDKNLPPLDLVFTNGHDVNLTALADTPTFKVFSVTGKFTADIDLRLYPFDVQKLTIEMEDQKAGVDQLVLYADKSRTSLDEGFLLASFGVASVGAQTYKHLYPPRFDRDDLYVSRYKFTLTADRFATSAAFSVFVPAFIIVLISLTGLWVPPHELEVRSNAGAPMLAAAVLFHYSLIQSLPATGYLTHADKLMLGVYLALLLNMMSTWLILLGDERWAELVFRRARTIVPILTAIIMALAVLV